MGHTDKFGTRIQCVQAQDKMEDFNWVFIPGGPGMDSSYFQGLIELLNLPGNVYRIDFPQNGSNFIQEYDLSYNFNQWEQCLKEVISVIKNPILVGHSFGAMYPLLFPELEQSLRGFFVLNSAPSLWITQALQKATSKGLPSFEKEMHAFNDAPSLASFKAVLNGWMPYNFPPETLEKGRALVVKDPFNYHAANWWLEKSNAIQYTAQWVPKIPMQIIGGSEDCVTPFEIYATDFRFQKPNIHMQEIQGAGHFPWVEKPQEVKKIFSEFLARV